MSWISSNSVIAWISSMVGAANGEYLPPSYSKVILISKSQQISHESVQNYQLLVNPSEYKWNLISRSYSVTATVYILPMGPTTNHVRSPLINRHQSPSKTCTCMNLHFNYWSEWGYFSAILLSYCPASLIGWHKFCDLHNFFWRFKILKLFSSPG